MRAAVRIDNAPTAVDRVYEFVREGIIQGRWPAGSPLREAVLAEETGCSRTPVREALQKLAAIGLIDYTPNQGARVMTWSSHALDEIFNIRTMLEAYAAQQAASRISAADIERLERLCDIMAEALAQQRAGYVEANQEFHATIIRAADAGRLATTLRGLVDLPLVMRTFDHYSERERERSLDHHRELVEAMRAREPEWAASVMRSHLVAARAALRRGGL